MVPPRQLLERTQVRLLFRSKAPRTWNINGGPSVGRMQESTRKVINSIKETELLVLPRISNRTRYRRVTTHKRKRAENWIVRSMQSVTILRCKSLVYSCITHMNILSPDHASYNSTPRSSGHTYSRIYYRVIPVGIQAPRRALTHTGPRFTENGSVRGPHSELVQVFDNAQI